VESAVIVVGTTELVTACCLRSVGGNSCLEYWQFMKLIKLTYYIAFNNLFKLIYFVLASKICTTCSVNVYLYSVLDLSTIFKIEIIIAFHH
jgi:hypothetical protein